MKRVKTDMFCPCCGARSVTAEGRDHLCAACGTSFAITIARAPGFMLYPKFDPCVVPRGVVVMQAN